MIIIIDGYNLLQFIAKGEAGPAEKKSFLNKLQTYAQRSHHQIHVIFDGGATPSPVRDRLGDLVIVHVGYQETADDYIKRMLEREQSKKPLLISSDRELKSVARKLRLEYLEVSAFSKILKDPEPRQITTSVKGEKLIQREDASENQELAAIMEQESRTLPVKSEEEGKPWTKSKDERASSKDKRQRTVLKKL